MAVLLADVIETNHEVRAGGRDEDTLVGWCPGAWNRGCG
jgi:hypothetical protein